MRKGFIITTPNGFKLTTLAVSAKPNHNADTFRCARKILVDDNEDGKCCPINAKDKYQMSLFTADAKFADAWSGKLGFATPTEKGSDT